MRCSLELMSIVWLFVCGVYLATRYLLHDLYFQGEGVVFYTWVVFAHIASTVAWAVLARAVGSGMRRTLFAFWIFTLTLMVAWFGMQSLYADTVLVFLVVVVLGLVVSSLATMGIDMDAPGPALVRYSSIVLLLACLAVVTLRYTTYFAVHQSAMVSGVALAVVYLLVQLLATWTYLSHNPKVWLVDNTCIFASMSPWSETVDLFTAFTPKTC
jgi:hypothetical protein